MLNSYTALFWAVFCLFVDNFVTFLVTYLLLAQLRRIRSARVKRGSLVGPIEDEKKPIRKMIRYILLGTFVDWIGVALYGMNIVYLFDDPPLSDFYEQVSSIVISLHVIFLITFYQHLVTVKFRPLVSKSGSENLSTKKLKSSKTKHKDDHQTFGQNSKSNIPIENNQLNQTVLL